MNLAFMLLGQLNSNLRTRVTAANNQDRSLLKLGGIPITSCVNLVDLRRKVRCEGGNKGLLKGAGGDYHL